MLVAVAICENSFDSICQRRIAGAEPTNATPLLAETASGAMVGEVVSASLLIALTSNSVLTGLVIHAFAPSDRA